MTGGQLIVFTRYAFRLVGQVEQSVVGSPVTRNEAGPEVSLNGQLCQDVCASCMGH